MLVVRYFNGMVSPDSLLTLFLAILLGGYDQYDIFGYIAVCEELSQTEVSLPDVAPNLRRKILNLEGEKHQRVVKEKTRSRLAARQCWKMVEVIPTLLPLSPPSPSSFLFWTLLAD